MWRLLILLVSIGLLVLVAWNVTRLVRRYRPPRKYLPPREPEIEEGEFKEVKKPDG